MNINFPEFSPNVLISLLAGTEQFRDEQEEEKVTLHDQSKVKILAYIRISNHQTLKHEVKLINFLQL